MRKKSMIEIRNQRRRNRSKRDNMAHSERPRLVIYRSNKNISAQVVNDHDGVTLASASSLDKDIEKDVEKAKSKTDISKLIGTVVAERALGKKIGKVVFDRNGYPYHGRVKAVADAAREAGLEF